ncbi:hypothetical protein PENTCL1PPCAC_24612, partial [Pristionchus entomophagus]
LTLASSLNAIRCFFDRVPEGSIVKIPAQKMTECPRDVHECITIRVSLEVDDDWEVYIERRCAHSKYECAGSHNTCTTVEAEPVWGRRRMEKRCCHSD